MFPSMTKPLKHSAGAAAALALAAALFATTSHADPAYTIAAPDTVLTGYVTGTSVTIRLGAPSSALLSRATLKLNGADVTSALHADGPGSMSGVVAGPAPGAERVQGWSQKTQEPVGPPTPVEGPAAAGTGGSRAGLARLPG